MTLEQLTEIIRTADKKTIHKELLALWLYLLQQGQEAR
ncbi:MAG: hypothetical protein J1F39_06430 [Clostridiales bacterium]|nr:hypothetical protein [Clostridiales bacterium]